LSPPSHVDRGVEQPKHLVDLKHRRRQSTAEVRRRRAHGVPDKQQAWESELALRAALAAVGVEQGAAGQHVRERAGPSGVGPVGQSRDGPDRGVERGVVAKPDEVASVGGADDERREDAAFVEKHQALVPVEVGLPRNGVHQRPGFRSLVQLVDAVDVGDSADAAGGLRRTPVAVHPSRPPGRVDDEVGPERGTVDDEADGPASSTIARFDDLVDMAGLHGDTPNGLGGFSHGPFVGAPLTAQSRERQGSIRQRRPDRFGADVEHSLVCVGQLSLQGGHGLRPDHVRVVELHYPPSGPAAGRWWTRVAVDQRHVRAPPRESTAEEEAGRAGADDRHVHDGSSSLE
jgi:hypothetical protein